MIGGELTDELGKTNTKGRTATGGSTGVRGTTSSRIPAGAYSRKIHAHFLGRLPNHCGQEIRIAGLAAAPRQRHVAGPGIARPFGAADQKNGFGVGCENGGNCRPNEARSPRQPERGLTDRRSRRRVSLGSVRM